MFKNRLITLALTFLLLSSSTFAMAETSDEYFKGGSGSSQQSITLDGTSSDNDHSGAEFRPGSAEMDNETISSGKRRVTPPTMK